MKKRNRKGFTIVELVIVIAVIGILAAVLIPTFSSVITKANESKALQEAKNMYTEYLVYRNGQPDATNDSFVTTNTVRVAVEVSDTYYYFTVTNGEIVRVTNPTGTDNYLTGFNTQTGAPESDTVTNLNG